MTDLTGPETVLAETRAAVTYIAPTARLLVTSPDWVVHAILESGDPIDHEWAPPWEDVQRILHAIPPTMTRLSIRFDRNG